MLWLLSVGTLLYLLPGGAIVAWAYQEGDWVERLVLAAGLSVVVFSLAFYASMLGLRLGSAAVAGLLAMSGIALLARGVVAWRRGWQPTVPRVGPEYVLLGILVLLVLGVRIWILRDMPIPRWGDSYQHVMITQLLIDHGGFFDSWEPYAPYAGLTTHFAFHANAAFFHWLSRVDASTSVLWVGQILNVLAILALYPLGKRIGGTWCGVLTVGVAGLLSATPMVYVNWGRYPQLTGQALLPLAVWVLWLALERPRLDWGLLAMAGLLAGGQALGYYRMPYFYAALVGGLALCVFLPFLRLEWRRWGSFVLRLAIVGAIAALVVAPWMVRISQSSLMTFVVSGAEYGRSWDAMRSEYVQWKYLPFYVSTPLLVLSVLALAWALYRRAGPAIALGLWSLGLFSLVATRMIGLPGATHFNAFASIIFVYAPVSLLIGWLGAQIVAAANAEWGRASQWAIAGLLVVVATYGAYETLGRSDPTCDLVKPPDLEAMAWIREHTPTDARFLVNGFSIYDGQSVVGSDAGWWIPLLTERENTMPPQYALVNERETEPGYGRRVVELEAGLRRTPLTSLEGLALACEEGISHVYVGQGEGRVGKPPPEPLFTAEELSADPAFEAVYHRDNVWVFALADGACRSLGRE
jgi:hypothetical protein